MSENPETTNGAEEGAGERQPATVKAKAARVPKAPDNSARVAEVEAELAKIYGRGALTSREASRIHELRAELASLTPQAAG